MKHLAAIHFSYRSPSPILLLDASTKQCTVSDAVPTPLAAPRTPILEKGPISISNIVEIPESSGSVSQADNPHPTSSSITTDSSRTGYPFPRMENVQSDSKRESLSVLIAEDNPINSRLLIRRLEKLGHRVRLTYDGQECHDHFKAMPEGVDVILMDIQASHSSLHELNATANRSVQMPLVSNFFLPVTSSMGRSKAQEVYSKCFIGSHVSSNMAAKLRLQIYLSGYYANVS